MNAIQYQAKIAALEAQLKEANSKSNGKPFSVVRADDYYHEDKKTGQMRGPYPMLDIQPAGGVKFRLGFGKCRTIATNSAAIMEVINAVGDDAE